MLTTTDNETICFQAQRALEQCQFHELRALQVDQVGEQLLITGEVGSYYLKQQAQEVVRTVAGDLQVVNTVHVD